MRCEDEFLQQFFEKLNVFLQEKEICSQLICFSLDASMANHIARLSSPFCPRDVIIAKFCTDETFLFNLTVSFCTNNSVYTKGKYGKGKCGATRVPILNPSPLFHLHFRFYQTNHFCAHTKKYLVI